TLPAIRTGMQTRRERFARYPDDRADWQSARTYRPDSAGTAQCPAARLARSRTAGARHQFVFAFSVALCFGAKGAAAASARRPLGARMGAAGMEHLAAG